MNLNSLTTLPDALYGEEQPHQTPSGWSLPAIQNNEDGLHDYTTYSTSHEATDDRSLWFEGDNTAGTSVLSPCVCGNWYLKKSQVLRQGKIHYPAR